MQITKAVRILLRSRVSPSSLKHPSARLSQPFSALPREYLLHVQIQGASLICPKCYTLRQLRCLNVSVPLSKKRTSKHAIQEKDLTFESRRKQVPVVHVWKNMTVQDLAKTMNKSIDHVFEVMIYIPNTNEYDRPNKSIDDINIIREIIKKSGLRSQITSPPEEAAKSEASTEHLELKPRKIVVEDLVRRDPVVTIMGHVDHGKTTLLDTLRESDIVGGEAGGITQHIGAFRVNYGSSCITFLDTPGHAAFSALRNRGAKATDIVILVVAADDGVMEQTRESIKMAKDAGVPIIVAINKIDKQEADVERTKSMLLQEGIQLEDFGGDVQAVPISALKGTNISQLMEATLLQAELLDLKSEAKGRVEGVVIESKIDPNRGKLCSGLVQRGVLRKSAILVAGTAWAKVRGLFDENGAVVSSAKPSTPVEIIGWRELPSPGETIYEVNSESLAKEIIEYRLTLRMSEKQEQDAEVIASKMSEHLKEYKTNLIERRKRGRYRTRREGPRPKEYEEDTDLTPKLYLMVKGDVDGSVEAFLDVLETYDCSDQCRLDVVHYGVGDVTESDVKLAETFNAVIYCYNVKISAALLEQCKFFNLNVRESKIIYRLIENIQKDIEEKLPPKDVEEELGQANVLQIFEASEGKKKVPVAGSRCIKGVLKKDALFRLVRGIDVIYEGKVKSMRHLKNEVETVKNGVECGVSLEDSTVEPKPGDSLICYQMIQVPQKSKWDPGF